jgi:hypothetical protein
VFRMIKTNENKWRYRNETIDLVKDV